MYQLSILIVTRNRPSDLERCLHSVFNSRTKISRGGSSEVIVVDNGSTDQRVRDVLVRFPIDRVIHLPKNYGDWEGRDIGRLQCKGQYILSLDDDAEVVQNGVWELFRAAQAFPRAAVIQPRVLEPLRFPGRVLGAQHDPTRPHLIAGFLGGACLYRSEALDRAGGFPHFKLGGAEPFLSYRFLDLGYEMIYVPSATIIHWASKEERVEWQRIYFGSAGRIKAVLRNEPRLLRRLAHLAWKPFVAGVFSLRKRRPLVALIMVPALFCVAIREVFSKPLSSVATCEQLEYLRRVAVFRELPSSPDSELDAQVAVEPEVSGETIDPVRGSAVKP